MTLEHFTRKPSDTHCVIYGAPGGELLVSYWSTIDLAEDEMFCVLDAGATSARIDTLEYLDRIENGTAHRDDRCRYCARYRRACGRDHSDATRRDWGRAEDGHAAPACNHLWQPVARGKWHCELCGGYRYET